MKNVQDIYPASPMQEFMLLHGLSHVDHDTLFNQFVFSVDHALQPVAFESAWNQVAAAHTSLRTAFIWKGVESPQQVVRQKVNVACNTVDISSQDHSIHESAIAELLVQDRNTGFDFRRAPLMRFTLIKMAEESWRVVWSSHHLVVDRWCIDQLMQEFQNYYRGHVALSPVATKRAPSYRDYIGWIQQQDSREAHEYWVGYLEGFSQPASVERIFASDYLEDAPRMCQASLAVGSAVTRKARDFSARAGVTLSCTVQAALALAVNKLVRQQDIVFGVTVAGRPAEVAHVDEIVGSFISTLPVRIRLDKHLKVAEWLRDLHAAQFANAGYDYLSPAQLRTCSSVPSGEALFDLLVVWLAQTNLQSEKAADNELPFVPMSEQYATAYPLTLSVIEATGDLLLRADSSSSKEQPLEGLLTNLCEALDCLVSADPELTLGQFQSLNFQADEAGTEDQDLFRTGLVSVPSSSAVSKKAGREDVRLDAMQEMLQGEWQSVLAIDSDIALDADFFELGGNSLKAAALHTRIEAATRKAIPLLALYEHATVEGMAATLVNETWPLRAGIAVSLQTTGTGAPLFCVASPEVNTLGYAMLTRHMPGERNLVLLQAPPRGDSLEQLHPDELGDFAADYIRALRDIQPSGPYSLLSMCSGAHIALHMIRQLEAEGEHVHFAGVVNTWSLYSISWRFYVNRLLNVTDYYIQRIAGLVKEKIGGPGSKSLPGVEADGSAETALKIRPDPIRVLPADSAVGLDNPWIKQVGFASSMPDVALAKATVSIFKLTKQPYWRIDDSALGWSRLASRVNVVNMAGDDHDSILREPNVQRMAEALERQLKSADVMLEDGSA